MIQSGGQSRDRTGDTRIFSPVLYQLSYLPFLVFCGKLYPQTNSKNIIELQYIYVKIFIAHDVGVTDLRINRKEHTHRPSLFA